MRNTCQNIKLRAVRRRRSLGLRRTTIFFLHTGQLLCNTIHRVIQCLQKTCLHGSVQRLPISSKQIGHISGSGHAILTSEYG